jgi:2-polyprenyl-6-methoxyphenol hydroxylase-like FAD-dependent oxidoreductase
MDYNTYSASSFENNYAADVIVVDGGLSGLATSLRLSKAGFGVVCLEPERHFEHVAGESLDWPTPELLNQLGLTTHDLIQGKVSTFQRQVILKLADDSATEYVPSAWLPKPPMKIELRTLHLDRTRLRPDLQAIALNHGVSTIHDRMASVEHEDDRIISIHTELGRRLSSKWLSDASGAAASTFGRVFHLPCVDFHDRKVTMWTYFNVPETQEGIALYAIAGERQYMNWIWEIPIGPGVISGGCVSPGSDIKRERAQGKTGREIFRRRLLNCFQSLLRDADVPAPQVAAFTCRVSRRECGPNWIIMGEAASLPDPITGNVVTTAPRHAAEATRVHGNFKNKHGISFWARTVYDLRVCRIGKFFNSLIEKVAYQWPIRDRMGILAAGDACTIPAWSINQIYSRLRPGGMISTLPFCLFLISIRGVAWIFYNLCSLFPAAAQPPGGAGILSEYA